jgi:hypothetical protein
MHPVDHGAPPLGLKKIFNSKLLQKRKMENRQKISETWRA